MSETFFHDEFACSLDLAEDISMNSIITENCRYRDNLDTVQQHEGGYQDTKQLYVRGWAQVINLFIGCVAMGIFIYRENRKMIKI